MASEVRHTEGSHLHCSISSFNHPRSILHSSQGSLGRSSSETKDMSSRKQGSAGATPPQMLPGTSSSSRYDTSQPDDRPRPIEHERTSVTQNPALSISKSQKGDYQPQEAAHESEVSPRLKKDDSRAQDSRRTTPPRSSSSNQALPDAAAPKAPDGPTAPNAQRLSNKSAPEQPEGREPRSGRELRRVTSKPTPPVPLQDDTSHALTEEVPDSWLVSPQVMQHIMQRRATAQAVVDEKAREAVIAEALAAALAVPTRKRTLPPDDAEVSTQDAGPSGVSSSSNAPIPGNNDDTDVKLSPHKKAKRSAVITTPENKSVGAAVSRSKSGATSSAAKSETTRKTRSFTQQVAGANVPVKLHELVGSSSSTARGRGKGVTSRSSKDPVKEALALTKMMNYAQYIAYIEENGPIRGGRKSKKFEGLVMFYLVQEGTSNKLGEVSRGRLDFVSFTGSRMCK